MNDPTAPGGRPKSDHPETSWATTALFRKVAHDIVGTAGVARGAIEELSRGVGADTSQVTMIDLARRSLARLDRLARRLRLAALAQEGPLVATRGPVDVASLVEAAIADATALDARKAVQMDRLPIEPRRTVVGDRELLTTAVAELVSNAMRFARKRVRIAVEGADGGRIAIVVDDDGPGWPAGFAEAIFPILRDRPGQRGSGVSLPIVAVIAREHAGELVLTQSPLADAQGRHGATARLELPVSS